MKRYNSVYDGVYTKPNEMVEEPNGEWVRWEDVQNLEARNKALLEALEKALDDSGCDGDQCGTEWHELARAAIAKAKGEQP